MDIERLKLHFRNNLQMLGSQATVEQLLGLLAATIGYSNGIKPLVDYIMVKSTTLSCFIAKGKGLQELKEELELVVEHQLGVAEYRFWEIDGSDVLETHSLNPKAFAASDYEAAINYAVVMLDLPSPP